MKQGHSSVVAIIMVNFNAGDILTESVHAALASTVPVEVFVSDNNSSDGSIDFLSNAIEDDRLHIVKNGVNLGFAKANNRVAPITTGEYLLILNPDCIIKPDTLELMVAQVDGQPEVGMAGCLIRNSDGSEQAGCRRRVPTPWRTLVRIMRLDCWFPTCSMFESVVMCDSPLPKKAKCEEAISGAFMLVRRTALEEVGLMDEAYFLHCEDLDWCMRFRKKGWKVLFVPDVEVVHTKGVCSAMRPVRVEWHKHKGMIRFYRKFFRHQYPLPLMWCVILAVWLRFSVLAIALTFRRMVH